MVSIDLPGLFVSLVPTGETVFAYSKPGRTREMEQHGQVEIYAGGYVRSVMQEGVLGTFGFTLQLVSWADVQRLELWIGRTVLVRERFGQKWYGTYYRLPSAEVRGRPGYFACTIELNATTYSEGV